MKNAQTAMQESAIPTIGFSAWLQRTRRSQITAEGATVPCGDCTACCTSSYFIHIRPDETQTLARIPKKLMFAAPRLPKGHVVLGYDEHGHCPMFINNTCSIYAYRPHTCRNYDCRIFPATGLPAGNDKPLIAGQARRWKFDFTTDRDHAEFLAVHAAAAFLRQQAACFPRGFVPNNTPQQAALALKVYDVFLNANNEPHNCECADMSHDIVEAVLAAYEKFENRNNA